MLLKLIIIAIVLAVAVCITLSMIALFFRKNELNKVLEYVDVIRDNIVMLGNSTFFVSKTISNRFSKKDKYYNYIEVNVFDNRKSFDLNFTKKLNIFTRQMSSPQTNVHELILNRRMTTIEISVIILKCYQSLKKLYAKDKIKLYFRDFVPTIMIDVDKEEIERQNKKIQHLKLDSVLKKYVNKFNAYQYNKYLPPWMIEECVNSIKLIGYSQDEAQKVVVDLMMRLSMDIDLEYKNYTIPRTLLKEDFDSALLNCQIDATKNGVVADDVVAFRMRCLPNETLENAKVAIVASQILAKR